MRAAIEWGQRFIMERYGTHAEAQEAHSQDEAGAVRFTPEGSLETFDGSQWVPLERLPDPPIGSGYTGSHKYRGTPCDPDISPGPNCPGCRA